MNLRSGPLRLPSIQKKPTRRFRESAPSIKFLAVLVVGYAFLSCAASTRYKVLTFFFDGVPDPNQVVETEANAPEPVDFTQLSAAERAEYLAERIEAPTVYFHEPVQQRECDSCHVAEQRTQVTNGWMAGLPELVVPIEELCSRCHEPPSASYVHGPVGTGRCDICHVAHQSPFPHLLRYEDVAITCRSCHQAETFVGEESHMELYSDNCTNCHDPHSSENRQFLLEDWATRDKQVSERLDPESDPG